MSRFFIRRPIVAIVIAIVTVLGGLVALPALPIAQFPADRPAADQRDRDLYRRRRAHHRAVGRDAARAADERRRQHALHAVDQRQRRHDDADRHVRRRHGAEHRPGQRAEPDGAGAAEPAARGQPVRADDAQADRLADAGHLAVLAEASYDALFLANYANINIIDALYRVPGVGEARIFGAGDYAMRIWVKPDALARLGLTVPDLANAIRQQSTVNPAGQVGAEPVPAGQEMTYTVRAQGRLQTAEEFGEIVVRSNPDGSVVRLQ